MTDTSAQLIRFCQGIAVVISALALSASAGATAIVLSDESSNGTPASLLDAMLDFEVRGEAGSQTLKLTLTNDTGSPDTFDISEVLFNASNQVAGLLLASATLNGTTDVTTSWSLSTGGVFVGSALPLAVRLSH